MQPKPKRLRLLNEAVLPPTDFDALSDSLSIQALPEQIRYASGRLEQIATEYEVLCKQSSHYRCSKGRNCLNFSLRWTDQG